MRTPPHLHLRVAGTVVIDRHLMAGPVVADIFSVTKSVLATVLGLAAIQVRHPWLDRPVAVGRGWGEPVAALDTAPLRQPRCSPCAVSSPATRDSC